MIALLSDSDEDVNEPLPGSASKRQKLASNSYAALHEIDSDDDQPLELIKQELKQQLLSQSGTPCKLHGGLGAGGAATVTKHAGDDLDGWDLEPLQRRLTRRPHCQSQQSRTSTIAEADHTVNVQQQGQQQGTGDVADFRHAACQGVGSTSNKAAAAAAGDGNDFRETNSMDYPGLNVDLHDQGCAEMDGMACKSAAEARQQHVPSRSSAAAAAAGVCHAAAGANSGDAAPVRARKPPPARRPKLTAEEREALKAEKAAQKAEERARKAAEKIAEKLAKQAQVEQTKAVKRFESFSSKKANGSLQEYEMVVVMDGSTAKAALGQAIAADLDRRRTIAWQVVEQLPLSGRWAGCCCFCFKRRQLCEADEHAIKTAETTRVRQFVEDVSPPYVQLVFQDAGVFLQQLQQDKMAGLCAAVCAAHTGCSLGVIVMSLKSHVNKLENQFLRQGGVCPTDWRRVQGLVLELHLATPGLQLRLLNKLEDVALHLLNTARVLGQQPYMDESQLEACGSAGPGAASKAAAAKMREDLGPDRSSFAVNTLGKVHGMGGNKAWAIAKAYPSFGALIAGFERARSGASGAAGAELLLQDLVEPADSKAKPRRVGPTLSKRLHLMLTCEDPDAVVEGDPDEAE